MSKIVELWNEEELPTKDGIYFANGDSISLSIQFYPQLSIKKGREFDLISFLNDRPDYLTRIDVTKRIEMSSKDQCLIGEGSYGSEGFIANVTADDEMGDVF